MTNLQKNLNGRIISQNQKSRLLLTSTSCCFIKKCIIGTPLNLPRLTPHYIIDKSKFCELSPNSLCNILIYNILRSLIKESFD